MIDPNWDPKKPMTAAEKSEFVKMLKRLPAYERREYEFRRAGFHSYKAYLESNLWRWIRAYVLRATDKKCAFCGGMATEVHHESYRLATLKGGDLSWLWPVCRACHEHGEYDDNGKKLFPEQATARMIAAAKKRGITPKRTPNRPTRKNTAVIEDDRTPAKIAVEIQSAGLDRSFRRLLAE